MNRARPLGLFLLCLLVFSTVRAQVHSTPSESSSTRPSEPQAPPKPLYDCGTMALYTLLRIEGFPTGLKHLEAILPQPNPGGHSMRELQEAAAARGLLLEGVLLSKEKRAIDRSMLVFLRQNPHGHFMVVRPVGWTGNLVQILDPNRPPDVVDSSELLASSQWTGLALRPARVNWPSRAGWILGICSVAVGLGGWLKHRGSSWGRRCPRTGKGRDAAQE